MMSSLLTRGLQDSVLKADVCCNLSLIIRQVLLLKWKACSRQLQSVPG